MPFVNKIRTLVKKQSFARITTTGIILVLVLGVIDYLTGRELSFAVFYVAPISLVVWYAGRRNGIIVAMVSVVVWFVADVADEYTYSNAAIPFWNAFVRLGFFVIIALILSRLKFEQRRIVNELRTELKILGGLIPICAWCKRIRNDKGFWEQVESYITDHSEASFTHSVCPDCREDWETKAQSTLKETQKQSKR